jgi:hypothetical protein
MGSDHTMANPSNDRRFRSSDKKAWLCCTAILSLDEQATQPPLYSYLQKPSGLGRMKICGVHYTAIPSAKKGTVGLVLSIEEDRCTFLVAVLSSLFGYIFWMSMQASLSANSTSFTSSTSQELLSIAICSAERTTLQPRCNVVRSKSQLTSMKMDQCRNLCGSETHNANCTANPSVKKTEAQHCLRRDQVLCTGDSQTFQAAEFR